ncbi:MAG TPA: glycosyltransferase family 2 protein [Thermoplasmata archaeon]|nr:glycosyltransferase family 2 protein [Thermoplasmata archaeon]
MSSNPQPTSPERPAGASTLSEAELSTFDRADVVVVLPTLNEEVGLARTLQDIPLQPMVAAGWNVRRLVIDGDSKDRTREVAKEWGVPVLMQTRLGKGAAIREALEFLSARHVRYAVILDADCTYPGGMVPAMVQLLDAGSQLVVGVREPTTSAKNDPREFMHRVGNRILNLTASQLAGLPILDLCSGFWAVDVRSVDPLALESDGFEIEAELFTKAYRAGYTVTQIPIAYRERVGVAKLHALRDGARILLTTVKFGRRELAATFRPPRPTRLRDFLSIAMVHGTDEFRVVADPTRRLEAELLAQRIRASRPASRVEIWTGPERSEGPNVPPTTPMAPSALTITLPAAGSPGDASATVLLPRTGRLVTIAERAETTTEPGAFGRSGAYRLEYSPARSPTLERMRALVANTFPTERAKELAFLGANGHYGTVAVWRRDGPVRRPGWILDDEPVPGDAHASESPPPVLADEGLP